MSSRTDAFGILAANFKFFLASLKYAGFVIDAETSASILVTTSDLSLSCEISLINVAPVPSSVPTLPIRLPTD